MRTRMASFSTLAVTGVLILGGARAVSAQQVVKLAEGETLTISGFISATLFNDRGLFSSFGQGQNAEIAACPVPIPGCTGQPGANRGIFDKHSYDNFLGLGGQILPIGRICPPSPRKLS